MSWRAIRGHKLRSALTVLGVIIGVAAVLTFVTLGASLQADIVGDLSTETTRTIEVGLTAEGDDGPPQSASQPVFTERDVENLNRTAGVEAVIPQGSVSATSLRFGGRTVAFQGVTATDPRRFDEKDIATGRTFDRGANETVINRRAARLFDRNVSVGDTVTLEYGDGRTATLTVVGVANETVNAGPFGEFDPPPRLYVPTEPFYNTTIRSPTTGERQLVYPIVTVRAERAEQVPEIEARIETYLAERSDARKLAPNGTSLRAQTSEELVSQIREVIETFTGFVTGVAVISLLVGSIGIVNIMLVSVTERTREIGIMKAVGARNRDVLQLFLTEAVMLGFVGALAGTATGFAGGYLAATALDLPPTYPIEWVPIAVGVGLLVGVAAGLYPAWNAAKTDPIDALRYE